MNSKFIPWIMVVVLGLIIWFQGCENDNKKDKEPETVTVPEVIGDFKPQKPIYIKGKDSIITRWKTKEIKTPNPVNDSLAIAYQKTKDSLDRYKMYLSAIQIRDFENVFEDDNIKITSFGSVQGDLKSISNKYVIKEREIEVDPDPETFLRLLGGGEIGNNILLNDFRYKVGFGLQNSKGNIYRLSYGKENALDYVYLGYDFSIFNWKR